MVGRCFDCRSFSFKLNEDHFCPRCAGDRLVTQRIRQREDDSDIVTPLVVGAVIGNMMSDDRAPVTFEHEGRASVGDLMKGGESGGGGADGNFDSDDASSSSSEEEESSSSDSCDGCDSCGGGGGDD